jgi:glycosyltransferase involved in cell wall biosynthesis
LKILIVTDTGVLDQVALASPYHAADVFVFPSRTDTFGLVLLEALACGCPVAAYPVTGPIDVIGDAPAGALDEDLGAAAFALNIHRAVARPRRYAERYSLGGLHTPVPELPAADRHGPRRRRAACRGTQPAAGG